MSQQPSGLRFDIYERVQLPDSVPAIQDLEEIELAPEIRVKNDGAQTLLTGHLRLSGQYVGKGDAEKSQQLEHLIPVEISLPAYRSKQREAIRTEIDNFDVDLVSDRSLNVTGVLTLHGITLESASDGGSWQGDGEDIVFVHRADGAVESDSRGQEEQAVAASEETAIASQQATMAEAAAETRSTDAESAHTEKAQDEDPPSGSEEALLLQEDDLRMDADPLTNEPYAAEEAAQEPEGEKEMKIAFAGKQYPEAGDSFEGQSLAGMVRGTESAPHAVQQTSQEEAPPAAASRGSTGDALEWKNLFLNGNEQENFSKMRMCIVQKEETIETIAERYGLHPRELMLCNRLSEQQPDEGQVLYIPR